jgi:hypothetical protein
MNKSTDLSIICGRASDSDTQTPDLGQLMLFAPRIAALDVLRRLCQEGNAGFHQEFTSTAAHQRRLDQTPAVYHALLNVAALLGRKAPPSNDGVCEILAAALRVHLACIMVQHRIECGASKLNLDAVYREWMKWCPTPRKPLLTGSDMGQSGDSGGANGAAVAAAENDDTLKTRRTGALGAARVAEKSMVAGSGIEAGGADNNADDAARLESDSESDRGCWPLRLAKGKFSPEAKGPGGPGPANGRAREVAGPDCGTLQAVGTFPTRMTRTRRQPPLGKARKPYGKTPTSVHKTGTLGC